MAVVRRRHFAVDKVFAAELSDRLEARLGRVCRGSPLGCDPTPFFQALERGIKGSVPDQEFVLGYLPSRARNALSVLRAENQRAQDEQIQLALMIPFQEKRKYIEFTLN